MLSVLIIEDTPEKIAAVTENIYACNRNINIEVVNDAKNALSNLTNKYYDLLLMDLYIPFEWGGNPDPNNAINLLKQLNEDEDLIPPSSILAITRKEELASEYKRVLDQQTVFVLQYNESTNAWRTQLQNKINTLLAIQKKRYYRQEYDYDVAIINALQIPEHSQIMKVWGAEWKRIECPQDECNNYYESIIKNKDGKTIRCIATYANQMASIASSTLTTKVIYNFHPKYLFMTGITAGVKRESMNYGDILVASELFDGASGKIRTNAKGKTVFEPDIRQKSVDSAFLNIITRLQTDRELLTSIYNNFPISIGRPSTQLAIHIGPIASVPAVISCKKEVEKLKIGGIKLQCIEMEAYGMIYAASNAVNPSPKIVAMLKSVSDFADEQKNDSYQEYAAYTSAALLKHIIIHELMF